MKFATKFLRFLVLPVCLFPFGADLSAVKQIRSHRYPLEIHHVTTEDGYILELHRIPRGRKESNPRLKYEESKNSTKKVVFITQSVFYSSSAFVALGPSRAIAYMIADAGYDVWIMNGRGSKNSQKHVKLSPKVDEFWKFSWHEHGVYDVPASLDYVLKITGECQVDYIGYSMGATMFFVLMSERPYYLSKVRTMIGLSPAVYLNNDPGLVRNVLPFSNTFAKLSANTQRLRLPPPELRLNEYLTFICSPQNKLLLRAVCDQILDSFSADGNNIDQRMLPTFFQNFPDTTSVRTIVHFGQLRSTARFEKYNFGRKMNLIKYGASVPPAYNLSAVTTPISLFWGGNDDWVSNADVIRLKSELPNVSYTKFIPNYNHFDFIWAANAPFKVYGFIIERLKSAGNSNCR